MVEALHNILRVIAEENNLDECPRCHNIGEFETAAMLGMRAWKWKVCTKCNLHFMDETKMILETANGR